MDYDDIGLELSRKLDKIPVDIKFNYIFVGEAQDLQQLQQKDSVVQGVITFLVS